MKHLKIFTLTIFTLAYLMAGAAQTVCDYSWQTASDGSRAVAIVPLLSALVGVKCRKEGAENICPFISYV
jgi:hypothetical protein